MRHDEGLEGASVESRRWGYGEAGQQFIAQAGRIAGVEHAGNGRRTDGGGGVHDNTLSVLSIF
jgi:hypothetical protein